MRYVIFALKGYPYSNYILNQLLHSGIFEKDDYVFVLEQDWIVPGKKTSQALRRYLKISGANYVFTQGFKKFLFLLAQTYAKIFNKKNSPYYPYNKLGSKINNFFVLSPFNNLKKIHKTNLIKAMMPDIIMSIGSMEKISKKIINIPKYGIVNTHASELPKYKGVGPILRALLGGEDHIGITLHYIDPGIDTGRIIDQRLFKVQKTDTEHSITMRCMQGAAELLINFITKIKLGEEVHTKENPSDQGEYFSIPTKKEIKKLRNMGWQFFKFRDYFRK